MENRHIRREDLFPFVHYEYGEAYFGSCRGMRFRIAREPLQNVHYTPPDKRGEAVLRAVFWPEPFSFAATEDDRKTIRDFPFTEEGLQQAAEWLDRNLPAR
ncbi:MAG: hypothetical protein Q4D81_05300 [Eubacteriales bacterium]|nr:hypothetical protein [Eubacteriales bacterium]